ncbi:MAG: hypothetical protein M0R06_03295 [Sphaerochaeta sp.]|jgi:hypothetical protein|nr:hypothetical protein [Dehalococcoidia bacterium]MCK9598039.1 hypothetical protein [Sphaerochaeta sp.]
MTEQQMNQLAELISIKTSERYMVIVKEHVATQIELHAANCAAKKYTWVKNLVSAIIGGVIVGLIVRLAF